MMEGFADFGQVCEEVCIKDFAAHGAVEALDVGVLCRFARLDVVEAHSVLLAPGDELRGDEFRAVVDPYLLGQRMALLELFEHADDTHRRERCVHFDGKGFAHTLNQGRVTRESTEANAAVFRFEQIYGYAEVYHARVLLGGIEACGRRGRVRVKKTTPYDLQFLLEWP